jgi:hypothetical protein
MGTIAVSLFFYGMPETAEGNDVIHNVVLEWGPLFVGCDERFVVVGDDDEGS